MGADARHLRVAFALAADEPRTVEAEGEASGHGSASATGAALPSDETARTYARMSDAPTRDEIDAKLALVDARTDTKFAETLGEMRAGFAELRGDLKALDAKVSALPSKFTFVSTVLGTGIAIAAIVLAVLAFGGQMFGQGFSADAIASKAAMDAVAAVQQPTTTP